MSKHEDKLEQKSPAKPEIRGSGALDDKDLEKVTGGDKASPKETFPKQTVTFNYGHLEIAYNNL
jgi:hypothetical protein